MKVYAKFRIDIDKEDESILHAESSKSDAKAGMQGRKTVQFHGKIYVYRGH